MTFLFMQCENNKRILKDQGEKLRQMIEACKALHEGFDEKRREVGWAYCCKAAIDYWPFCCALLFPFFSPFNLIFCPFN